MKQCLNKVHKINSKKKRKKESHANGLFLGINSYYSPDSDNIVTQTILASFLVFLFPVQSWYSLDYSIVGERGGDSFDKGAMRRFSFTIERPRQLKVKNANSLYTALTLRAVGICRKDKENSFCDLTS